MGKHSEVFVGFDTAKKRHAVAVADAGRDGEIRYLYLGEIDSAPATVERVIRKLASRYEKVHVCYEAGPTGYGLYHQVRALGHECTVVAPSLIPKRAGERVKTNRRDATTLARLLRAGELTAVWVPDVVHEAVRDLVAVASAEPVVSEDQPQRQSAPSAANKRSRNIGALPKHLPRCEIVIEPNTTTCPCCAGKLHRIGEDISEALDVIPAILRVLRFIRPKYACRAC